MSPEPQTAEGRWRSTRQRLIDEGLTPERAEAGATAPLDADALQGVSDEIRVRIDHLTDMVQRLGAEVDHLRATAGHTDSCHTLAAAGATGTVGPNLDQLTPSQALVEHQVTNGGGGMPVLRWTAERRPDCRARGLRRMLARHQVEQE
jgi:hypothetical protein